jgi:hypothetical protein
MADQRVLERIGSWERDGLIDEATAGRLRAVEVARVDEPPPAGAGIGLGSLGLNLDLGEAFAYLGSFFLLGAWYWFIGQATPGDGTNRDAVWAFGTIVPAIVFAGLGFVLRRRPGRIGRSAGIWLLLSGIHAFFAAPLAVSALWPEASPAGGDGLFAFRWLFGAVAWLLVAAVARRLLAAVPTQLGLIAAILAVAITAVDRAGHQLGGTPVYGESGPSGDGIVPWMLVAALGTVLGTLALGFLARLELAGGTSDPGVRRRLAITRFAAGSTLTVGATITFIQGTGGFGRPVEPVLADILLLVVAAILGWLAFNREASAYVYPAGLAVLIAFTDLNGSYVARDAGTGVALLLEGAALIAVGYVTEIARRRLGRRRVTESAAGEPLTASSGASTS